MWVGGSKGVFAGLNGQGKGDTVQGRAGTAGATEGRWVVDWTSLGTQSVSEALNVT